MENQVRELLRDIAEDIPPQREAPPGLRSRARRRIATTVGVTLLAVAALVLGSVVAVRSITTSSPVPANPVPTTPPPTTVKLGTFAQVHGWITYGDEGRIMAVDPANPTDVVSIAEFYGDPIGWSRDGTRLLLSIAIEFRSSAIFVLNGDGSRTRIMKRRSAGEVQWGSFSPNGTKVTYSLGGGTPGPVIEDAAGGEARPLVAVCRGCGEGLTESAAWSPDGSRIAWIDFWENSPKYGHHVYSLSLVNADGTGLHEQVVNLVGGTRWPDDGLAFSYGLVWSPDGSELAFWQGWDGLGPDVPGDIFVVNADGSGLRQITDTGDNRWPVWSPDGSRIAFVHDGELYTMAADGTDMRPVSGIHPDGPIAWNWAS